MQTTTDASTTETTTSTGTANNDIPGLPSSSGGFDVGNFGGLGLFGGAAIFIGLLLLNWKMNGRKPSIARQEKFEQTKANASAAIVVNDQKEEVLKTVVEQKQQLVVEEQKKIDTIVDTAAAQLKKDSEETDIATTVDEITSEWKG